MLGGNPLSREDIDLHTFIKVKDQRNEHWRRIRRLDKEFRNLKHTGITFFQWVEDTYGLHCILDPSGNVTANFTITDEKKYILFLLKLP